MITILKAIFSFLLVCCKIVYRILKLLRIRILTLYLIVCGLLQLIFHAFDEYAAVFWAGFALCLLITLIAWVLFLRRKSRSDRAPRERKPVQAEDDPEEATEEVRQEEESEKKREIRKEAKAERIHKSTKKAKPEQPKYFDVKGNSEYYFAEYEDRYELFRRGSDGDTLVRTDYKTNERSRR